MFKKITFILFILHCCFTVSAQEKDKLQSTTILFSNTKLTVQQVLDEINQKTDISIVYNGKDPFVKISVKLSKRSMSVDQALDEVKDQAPVEYIFTKNHVIVKARKLADTYQIQGFVRDASDNEPLIAADIFIAGTNAGTVTDVNGKFSFKLQPGQYQLVCKYVGYKDQVLNVSLYQEKNLEFDMETLKHQILEVNVTGNLRDIDDLERGRNIETIDAKTINRLNTNDVNEALHGTINGVWTTKVSGAPGDHSKIRIRGVSSIFASTDPLYVVDGMIIPVVNLKTLGIADLNNHDVNSITVLKDAASTALYGYLGGNGVILIETKKGGGKTKFDFSVKRGYQQFNKRYPMMDTKTFISTLDSSDFKARTTFFASKDNLHPSRGNKYPYYIDSLGNVLGSDNFQNELFRTGKLDEFQLSGQGSLKNIDYYISGDYYNHSGIIVNSHYKKYTLTGNFSKIVKDKFSARILYKGSHQENKNNLDNYMGNDVIYRGINYEPAYKSTPDSFFYKNERLYYNPYSSNTYATLSNYPLTPEDLFYKQVKEKNENTNTFTGIGFYRINNDLSLNAIASLSFRNAIFSSFIPGNPGTKPKFLKSTENYVILSQQYDLHYEKKLKNHNISGFIRYMNYNDNIYWKVDSTYNVVLDGLTPESNVYLRGSQAIYGEKGSVVRSINSLIATLNYNYRDKYFISAIGNIDHLKEGYYVKRSDLFPSIALTWDISKEPLLHVPVWVNTFNVYANWGKAGNYPLNSLSNDLFSVSSKYTANNEVVPGVYISNLANHYLTYEKEIEYNFGTEIKLLQNRIIFSADRYIKYNSNLLIQRTIPLYYGGGFFYQNIGEMKNQGIELGLEITPVDNANFAWTTRFGYSKNNQRITKLYQGTPINFSNSDVLFPDFYAKVNEPLGTITGFNYQGEWKNLTEAQKESGKYVNDKGSAYSKIDTTSKNLSDGDKMPIGNSIPDFTFHWINNFIYKNFSCNMIWYGVIGVDKFNATKASTYITGINSDVRNIVMDSISSLTGRALYESSYFVENASFVRLKTISFTYSQSRKIASKISLRYTLSFENLITLTHYSGYDPEATIYTDNNFSDNAVDLGAYPNPKAVYFSINMTF